jgi:DNA-binding NtrC family response regulator
LFLDEVAEMAPDMQTKLLRFLQDFTFRRVGGNAPERTDVRIICATNRDPLREIAAGHLREDLYFRLHVIPLQIPRLHERDDDVLDIAYALMRRYSAEEHKNFSALSPAVQDFFRHYEWPGNVRQLQNLLRYICVMFDGDTITADMLPASLLPETDVHGSADGRGMPARPGAANPLAGPVPDVHPSPSTTSLPPEGLPEWLSGMSLADIERHVIESTVARMHGNVPQAAAHLGVAPSTLYRKRLSWLPELQKEGETLPPSLTPERTQP